MTSAIYALVDPRDSRIRYVGKTSRTLRQRLNGHVADARHGRRKAAVVRWVAGLLSEGVRPRILLLERVPVELDTYEREQVWIRRMRCPRLLNHCDRGPGTVGYRRSDQATISKRMTAWHADPENRAQHRAGMVASWLDRRPTHCKHGHEFTAENTSLKPNGTRRCRECNRIGCRRDYAKHDGAASRRARRQRQKERLA